MATRTPTKRIEDVAPVVKDGKVPAYTGAITDLPVRFQTLFKKRYEENFVRYSLKPSDAEAEARQYIALQIYREVARKGEKAKQLGLYEVKSGSSMTPDKVGGGR